MTEKQKYWIRDAEGVFALVEGADARDWFTKVKGWAEADEPGAEDQVIVHNEHPDIIPGRLPYGAIPGHAGRGWYAGPPEGGPEESAPADRAAPVAEPAKPIKAAAPAAGEKKE